MQGTTCRLGALRYRTIQGARPGQKWQKKVQLQPKVQLQETQSTPEASHSLNLSQDRETNVISHSETFALYKHRCSFQCRRPCALASTTTLQKFGRAPLHARSLFKRGIWRGCPCRSSRRDVLCHLRTHSNVSKLAALCIKFF